MQTGRGQRLCLFGQRHAVGGQRQVAHGRLARQHAHEVGKIAAKQRLAARQPDLVDARLREDVDQRAHFFKLQQVLAGQPHVLRLGHAVTAAQIASVGHRQPQIFERTAEQIGNHLITLHQAQPRPEGKRRALLAELGAPTPRDLGAAGRAAAGRREIVPPNQVPVALDQHFATMRAVRMLEVADGSRNISSVDVMQPRRSANVCSFGQHFRRRVFRFLHLVVAVKRRDMPGDVGRHAGDELGETTDFIRRMPVV